MEETHLEQSQVVVIDIDMDALPVVVKYSDGFVVHETYMLDRQVE